MASFNSTFASQLVPLPQFIIALLLVRSKPATIPIKAYFAELRTSLLGRPRSRDILDSHTDLDTIAYWRDAFRISQQENRSLRARVAELEGRNEHHSDNSALKFRDRDQDTGPLRGKRKRNASTTRARSTRIAKQARIANTSSPRQSRHNDIHNASPAVRPTTHQPVPGKTPGPGIPEKGFHYYIDALQRVTTDTPAGPEAIAACLRKALETIRSIVSPVRESDDQTRLASLNRGDSNIIKSAADTSSTPFLNIVGRLIPVLLQAMDHMIQSDQNQAPQASVIYHFVETYGAILHQVCNLAAQNRPSALTRSPAAHAKGKENAHKESSNAATAPFNQQPEIIPNLCDLAVAMTTALEPTKPAQARMLEGCLSLLLTKVGSVLRISIFGANNDDSNINTTKNPSTNQTQTLEEAANAMLEAQSPPLISILSRTSTHLPTPPASSSSSTQLPPQPIHPSHLLTRRKLQNTLLTAVFPNNALGLMKQTLAVPDKPPCDAVEGDGEGEVEVEVGGREWFKSEVFRLVGWEALDEYLRVGVL